MAFSEIQEINEAQLSQGLLREGAYNRKVIFAICLALSMPKYHVKSN